MVMSHVTPHVELAVAAHPVKLVNFVEENFIIAVSLVYIWADFVGLLHFDLHNFLRFDV